MSDVDVPQASSEDPVPATLPPGPAPGPEDLLGLRVAAALIDLALLAGILAILSAAVGQAKWVSLEVRRGLIGRLWCGLCGSLADAREVDGAGGVEGFLGVPAPSPVSRAASW